MKLEELLESIGLNKSEAKSDVAKQAAMFAVAMGGKELIETSNGRDLIKTIFGVDIPEPKTYANEEEALKAYEKVLFDLVQKGGSLEPLKKYASSSFEDLLDNFSGDKNLVMFIKKLQSKFDFTVVDAAEPVSVFLSEFKDVNSEMEAASNFVKENVCENDPMYLESDYKFKDFLFKFTMDVSQKAARTAASFENTGELGMWGTVTQIYASAVVLANLRDIYNITHMPVSDMQVAYAFNIAKKIIENTVLHTLGLTKYLNDAKHLKRFAEFKVCKLVQDSTVGQFEEEDENPLAKVLENLAGETKTIDLGNGETATVGAIKLDGGDKAALKQKLQEIIDKL